jgi:PREDICTED: similar to missing oocyte CG7074-PA
MANPKMDILWSPIHADKFITFGNELRLFQIEYITDRNGRAQRSSAGFILSKNTFAQLLSMNSDINSIKVSDD